VALVESTSSETPALAVGFDRLARYYRVAEVFLLRRKYPAYSSRVTWKVADVRDEPRLTGRFDAIITPFVMDCFDQAEGARVVTYLEKHAAPDAWWLHADFHLPLRGWERARAKAILWLMYTVFRWVVSLPASQLSPIDRHLQSAGFVRQAQELICGKLVRSDLWYRSSQ